MQAQLRADQNTKTNELHKYMIQGQNFEQPLTANSVVKQVSLRKRDVESAIRDGVISVEVGTALWRRWRAKEQQDVLPGAALGHIRLPSMADFTEMVCTVILILVVLSAAFISWGKYGVVGLGVSTLLGGVLLMCRAHAALGDQTTLRRDMSILAAVALFGVTAFAVFLFLNVSIFTSRPRIDVFGVVPQDNSLRILVLASISTGLLYLAQKKYSSSRIKLAALLTAVVTLDAAFWWIANRFMAVESGRVVSTVITCAAVIGAAHWVESRRASDSDAVVISSQQAVVAVTIFLVAYVARGNLSSVLLIIVSIAGALLSLAQKRFYQLACSLGSVAVGGALLLIASFGTITGCVEMGVAYTALYAANKHKARIGKWVDGAVEAYQGIRT